MRRELLLIGQMIEAAEQARILVAVNEAFGNCPQYLPQRTVDIDTADREPLPEPANLAGPEGPLTDADNLTISRTTSFLLGTTHPQCGNDVSHRGGAPGFLRCEGNTLWWPDYPGNNLFNSMGNLHVDSEAGVLLPDFTRRIALHLHGTAELVITGSADDEGHTGRRIVFSSKRLVRTSLPAVSQLISDYPRNPPVAPRVHTP